MKNILLLLLTILLLFSCTKNDDKPKKIDIGLLENTWKVPYQTIDQESFAPFTLVKKLINIDNGEIMWADTLELGASSFVFNSGSSNTCQLNSEHYGEFTANWSFDQTSNMLDIHPYGITDTSWSVTVNGHQYFKKDFIRSLYEVVKLTETTLELRSTDSYLYMMAE